jgi:hypothetical protein
VLFRPHLSRKWITVLPQRIHRIQIQKVKVKRIWRVNGLKNFTRRGRLPADAVTELSRFYIFS